MLSPFCLLINYLYIQLLFHPPSPQTPPANQAAKEEQGTHHPPIPPSTSSALQPQQQQPHHGNGRLHLSLATAVLSVAQRLSTVEERASARAEGAEGLARQALEETRREVGGNSATLRENGQLWCFLLFPVEYRFRFRLSMAGCLLAGLLKFEHLGGRSSRRQVLERAWDTHCLAVSGLGNCECSYYVV